MNTLEIEISWTRLECKKHCPDLAAMDLVLRKRICLNVQSPVLLEASHGSTLTSLGIVVNEIVSKTPSYSQGTQQKFSLKESQCLFGWD
jgi:hypothetical protein